MRSKVNLVLLATLSAAGAARSEMLAGNALYAHCEKQDGNVTGFVIGSLDRRALDLDFAWYAEAKRPDRNLLPSEMIEGRMCVPKGVVLQQILDVFCGYLKDHPEKRQMDATGLLDSAMAAAWPCQ